MAKTAKKVAKKKSLVKKATPKKIAKDLNVPLELYHYVNSQQEAFTNDCKKRAEEFGVTLDIQIIVKVLVPDTPT